MNKKKAGIAFILLLACVLAGQALAQGSEIKFNSNVGMRQQLTALITKSNPRNGKSFTSNPKLW